LYLYDVQITYPIDISLNPPIKFTDVMDRNAVTIYPISAMGRVFPVRQNFCEAVKMLDEKNALQ
jgi:hypothetical protein